MSASRVGGDGRISDFRLSLVRVGDKVVSILWPFDDSEGSSSVRFEYEPDWNLIAEGVEVLQCPEAHPGEDIASLSRELGLTAFGPPIANALARLLEGGSVRLWLNPDARLAQLPWEACSVEGGFIEGAISMHPGLSVIREVPGGKPKERKRFGAVRVLIAWADPSSDEYPHLPGIDAEVRSVLHAFSTAECRNFEVEELPYATPSSLARVLRNHPPDILHFVGHGDLRPTGGVVVLDSGDPNRGALLHGDELAGLLADASVQLVVLSGCMTGDAVCGVGPELGKHGVPAVVAMQAPLHDASAGLFARAFYGCLAMGESVDEAVLQGRCAIRGAGNDWAVPVGMRTPLESPRFGVEFDFDLVPEAPKKRHNLTYDERPFIGRHTERLAIRDRICLKRQRLLTITGMGGMGKTRLGKQVSAELLDDFPDGVWMVECDTLSGREELLGAIASTLGLTSSGSELEQDLISYLESKKLLLYLDCFEGLVDQAELLDNLLKRTADCQILVSSRVVLGLPREFEYRLEPMTLKKKGSEASDGVALFVEAASHSVNSFELTSRNRAMVKELCQELEGVPLALVLAAGRLRHLSVTELLDQVRANPLDVLRRRGGPKDRQADLYRVVSSSFRLLAPSESGLLDKLSLFIGGFYVEDAAEVCGRPRVEMLHGLSTLRDHSLVQVQLVEDRTRYKLLDTVREFLEQLERDEAQLAEREACARRHAERYARLAETIGNNLVEGHWSEGISLLWSEIGNLRAAGEYSVASGDHALTVRLAAGLCRPYFEVTLYADFEKLAQAGLDAAIKGGDRAFEARMLGLIGALHAVRKDEAGWRSNWKRRLELCEEIGDLNGATDTLTDLAWECFDLNQIEEAYSYVAQGVDLGSRAENYGLLAVCYATAAQINLKMGDKAAASENIAGCKDAIARSHDRIRTLFVMQHLATVYQDIGLDDETRSTLIEVLKLGTETHRYRQVAWVLPRLAAFHERKGEKELALVCFMAAVKLQSEFSTRQGEKARPLLMQFLKRHDDMGSLMGGYKKTSWRALLQEQPYWN